MKQFAAISYLICVAFAGQVSFADEKNLGELEYENSCVQCHGVEGMGNGYLADALAIAPPDLTSITSRNGGAFPISDVYQLIISGAWDGRVHATDQMPFWGARYRLEANSSVGADPSALSIATEKRVHERVAALVNHIHRLQRPSPENIEAAFAIIEKDFASILMINPKDLELVVIVPRGYRADAARANLLWTKQSSFIPGSGVFDMKAVGLRDLVGGKRQTSFVFAERDRETASKILGNSELIVAFEKEALTGEQPTPNDSRVEFSFEYEICIEEPEVIDPTGFSGAHLRDRATHAKYYEFELAVAVENFASGPCD